MFTIEITLRSAGMPETYSYDFDDEQKARDCVDDLLATLDSNESES